jgi:hypothetical protein
LNRLFALLYSTENVEYAAKHRFVRVTPGYILIYTEKSRLKPPSGRAVEIKKDKLNTLTAMDESWLFDCGITLLAEHTAANTDGMKNLSDMVDRLEAELEGVNEDGSE